MTTNVCFALLDAAVIAGRSDEPLVGDLTHARMLEEVAALGGVLIALEVQPGDPVVVDLDSDLDAIVAALAVARVGGCLVRGSELDDHRDDDSNGALAGHPGGAPRAEPGAAAFIVSSGSSVPASARPRIVRGEAVQEPDLDWVAMIRAGRTDPAACRVLAPEAPYSSQGTVTEQIEVLAGSSAPYAAAELRRLLQV